ncbi:hypothetical protein PRIPAC_83860 [Pristionchus pacificus]|uniref:Uncharacterized protein n=1 Tax=Pristionchus pacificus TaxID=54126 RepID=A0A2A6CC71_PRIPA|nr:hypothetical protein PRIPAC_83860 [Pristionchus pacificus]|eukprot:PDM75700.1 hypothetical protein PRIPAC_40079 [Pristionchus pacificus]
MPIKGRPLPRFSIPRLLFHPFHSFPRRPRGAVDSSHSHDEVPKRVPRCIGYDVISSCCCYSCCTPRPPPTSANAKRTGKWYGQTANSTLKIKRVVCFVHGSCSKDATESEDKSYLSKKYKQFFDDCKRYFIIEAVSLEKVEIEFRDHTFDKVAGAGFSYGVKESFTCKNNIATASASDLQYSIDNEQDATSNELYCKFTLTATNNPKNMDNAHQSFPDKVTSLKITRPETIEGLSFPRFKYPCDWNKPIFINTNDVEKDEEKEVLMSVNNDADRQCKTDYINWYKEDEASDWVKIKNNFDCNAGTITAVKFEDGSTVTVKLETGKTKCTKKKCAQCACTFCDGHNESRPNFTSPIDETCAKMTCPNKMLVYTSPTVFKVHAKQTIDCTVEKKWEGFDNDIVNITCIDEVRCSELNPIKTDCSGVTAAGKNCTEALLTDSGARVCDDKETRFQRPGEQEQLNVKSFECDTATGNWKATLADNKTSEPGAGTNVYCMLDIKLDDVSDPMSEPMRGGGGLKGGQLIAIIVGVAFVAVIIVIVVVLCLRRYFKMKGNRDEMKSVSVTGRGDKKSKKKKTWNLGGKSSGSKTSEQRGVPPAVGPDTGKPDKPAELIDIKLDSEKRETEKEGKAKDAPSVVNTVTGTTFDKSKVDQATGKSARSATGTGSKVDGKPKKKLKVKDGKVELDKHGRGMTDDDDYNIDEGVKPVDSVDKNKKPYAPEVDPRKKMINVTVTEDEDGRIQQKNKPQPF